MHEVEGLMVLALLRMVLCGVRAWFGRDAALRCSRLPSKVHLDQVDMLGHMNQSRYAEQFELGRADLLVRSGAWQRWRSRDVVLMVARQQIVYRRELKPWQRFVMDTRVVGFDGRLMHMQGYMLVGDRVHAVADVYVIMAGPDGVLDAEAVRREAEEMVTTPLQVEAWRVVALG